MSSNSPKITEVTMSKAETTAWIINNARLLCNRTVPSTSSEWIHLPLSTVLWEGCSYAHFTDKGIEPEKLSVPPKGWKGVKSWGLYPDSLALGSDQAMKPVTLCLGPTNNSYSDWSAKSRTLPDGQHWSSKILLSHSDPCSSSSLI